MGNKIKNNRSLLSISIASQYSCCRLPITDDNYVYWDRQGRLWKALLQITHSMGLKGSIGVCLRVEGDCLSRGRGWGQQQATQCIPQHAPGPYELFVCHSESHPAYDCEWRCSACFAPLSEPVICPLAQTSSSLPPPFTSAADKFTTAT